MIAARILVTALAAALLAGCISRPVYRPVSYVTPKDPPPLPGRKPAPPADLAGWTGAPVAGVSGVAEAPPGLIDVEVQALSPQTASQDLPPPPVTQAAAPQPAATQAPQPVPTMQPAASTTAAAPADGRYRVAAGDSLYGIARRYGLPVRAVIDANNLQPPYALTIGQELSVPRAQVHEVAAGDTIFSIARTYDIDRSELVRLNAIQPPYTIPVGQKLLLPTPGSAVESDPAPVEVAYTPPGTPVPDAVAPPPAAAPQPPAAATNNSPAAAPKSRDAVRAALASPPRRAGAFIWPVQGAVLSSYGAKSGGEHNDGINIAAPRGTPVRAAENGVVAYAGQELKGFGKLLLVKHADGWVTAYAHNEELLVAAGDTVRQGQTIATVGSSGNVDRPQLHFEVRRGTRAVDPSAQLSPRTASAAD
ncbi:MAG: peptidoglycan DD-metalloendopeptidase family protein [Bacteroidota bacterium]|nr:peptidoglycan DD-metalloendopeptidase family protein [Kiloniellaceae bacterium]